MALPLLQHELMQIRINTIEFSVTRLLGRQNRMKLLEPVMLGVGGDCLSWHSEEKIPHFKSQRRLGQE